MLDDEDEYVPSRDEIADEIARLKLAGYVVDDDQDQVEFAALTAIAGRRRRPGATYAEIFARRVLEIASLIDFSLLPPDERAEYEKDEAAIAFAQAFVDRVTVKS